MKKITFIILTFLLISVTTICYTKSAKATDLRTVTMVQTNDYLFLANPDSGKLLVFKNSGEDIGELVQTITLGNYPSDLLISGNNLYVALSGTTIIKIIDKNTLEIKGELQTPKLPSNLAIDGNLLWVTIARNNGSNFGPFAIQLSSDGLSATTIYQPEWPQEYDVVGNEQILINPNNHHAYIACSGYSPDNIKKFDLSDPNNVILLGQNNHGSLGSNGQEMNFSSDYSKIYYSTGSGGNSIYGYSIVVVNSQTLTKTSSMVTGAYPNSNSIYSGLLYAGRMDPTPEPDIYIFDANNISIKNYSFPFMEELVARGISAGPGLFAATNKYLYLLNQSDTTYTPIYNFLTNAVPTTCTSWTYSNWSACVNGTKTRTIVSSSPSGCTGGNPVLTQSCSSTQTCTSWNYSNWSTCTNGTQTRTITSSSPSGCTGGNPVLTQSCSNGLDLIVNNIVINSDNTGNHIRVTVKNIGNQNLVMNQSVILKLTFGTNISEIQSCNTSGWAPCSVGNKYNGAIAINAYGKSTLTPGEEYSITFDNGTYLLEKVEFDNNSNYLIRAMVDWTDMIEESNENNNTLTKSYTPTSATSWTTGQWIKTDDSSTVYFLDNNNVRHSYPNEKIWYSYFNNDFSFVKTVTKEQLSSYSLGKNVPFKSGQLIKIPSVPKVYKVGDNGIMQWIKTENTAKALYGNNWNKLVHDLDESSFSDYTEGNSLE